MAEQFNPIASEQTDGYVPSNLGDIYQMNRYNEWPKEAFNPLVEFAQQVWTNPEDLSTRPIAGRGHAYRPDTLHEGIKPIDFENTCNPVSGSVDLPELNLDCFRLQALEQEQASLQKLADLTIRATPDILSRAIATDQAFGDIPIMFLSQNTESRLQGAILTDQHIQDQSEWPLYDLSLVDMLNPQLAYESLHGEEKRVWDYLEREGLDPFLTIGQDGRVQMTVRPFD